MLELESRLLRLLKLVKSITVEENETYCADEILNILQQSTDYSSCSFNTNNQQKLKKTTKTMTVRQMTCFTTMS